MASRDHSPNGNGAVALADRLGSELSGRDGGSLAALWSRVAGALDAVLDGVTLAELADGPVVPALDG